MSFELWVSPNETVEAVAIAKQDLDDAAEDLVTASKGWRLCFEVSKQEKTRADALQVQVDSLQAAVRTMAVAIRTVTCRHWVAGSCAMGDACSFRHDVREKVEKKE